MRIKELLNSQLTKANAMKATNPIRSSWDKTAISRQASHQQVSFTLSASSLHQLNLNRLESEISHKSHEYTNKCLFALDVAKIDRCFLRKFDFEIRVSAKQCKKGSLPDFISLKQHPALNTG